MAKNYFTDEQVKNLGWDCSGQMLRVGDGTYKYIFTLAELKALMNLALEKAIGEPVGYCGQDFIGRLTSFETDKASNGMWQKPLYSVQELDN